jgi:hypothetical protein
MNASRGPDCRYHHGVDSPVLNYAQRDPFDAGLFTGRYLQIVGLVDIGWMIVEAAYFHAWDLNFGVIVLFWAGSALKRRSRSVRLWVIWICRVFLLFVPAVITVIVIFHRQIETIDVGLHIQVPWVEALLLVAAEGVLLAIPYVALQTPAARRQFAA